MTEVDLTCLVWDWRLEKDLGICGCEKGSGRLSRMICVFLYRRCFNLSLSILDIIPLSYSNASYLRGVIIVNDP